MVPGFEPMTFGMWASSHNHYTRAPTLVYLCLCLREIEKNNRAFIRTQTKLYRKNVWVIVVRE